MKSIDVQDLLPYAYGTSVDDLRYHERYHQVEKDGHSHSCSWSAYQEPGTERKTGHFNILFTNLYVVIAKKKKDTECTDDLHINLHLCHCNSLPTV
jgi:hypothetical protein